jgi:hypothetical protein
MGGAMQGITAGAVSESVIVKLIATVIIGITIPPALKFAKWIFSKTTWSSIATRKGLRFKRVSDIYNRLVRITDDEFEVISHIYDNGGLAIINHTEPAVQSLLSSGLVSDDMDNYDDRTNHAIRLDKAIMALDLSKDPVTSNPLLEYPKPDVPIQKDLDYTYIYSPWAVSMFLIPFTKSGSLVVSTKRFIALAFISLTAPFMVGIGFIVNSLYILNSIHRVNNNKTDWYMLSPFTWTVILVALLMFSLPPFKAMVLMLRGNVAAAPASWTSISSKPYVLARSSDRLSYLPVTYRGTCILCSGEIEVLSYRSSSGLDRLLGTCVNNPREHRYTFDHVTKGGILCDGSVVLEKSKPETR